MDTSALLKLNIIMESRLQLMILENNLNFPCEKKLVWKFSSITMVKFLP